MDDRKVGRAIREMRLRRSWRQADLGAVAGVSRQVVSRVERGLLSRVQVATVRDLVEAVGCRLELHVDSPGHDLDRLLNARHAAMHEIAARLFRTLPGWITAPEVSFSVYGERGVIDILARHEATKSVLVVELKTSVVDINDLLASMDRRARLAPRIAHNRGWPAASVSSWALIADTSTNRRRVGAHAAVLRTAFPSDGRAMHAWLRSPGGRIAAMSFLSVAPPGSVTHGTRRIRHPARARRSGAGPPRPPRRAADGPKPRKRA